jgi:hypothetical protein
MTHKEAIKSVLVGFPADMITDDDFANMMLDYLDARGLVMVSKEPTDEMHNAARDWSDKKYGKPIGIDASDGCYRTMISAALKE